MALQILEASWQVTADHACYHLPVRGVNISPS